MQQLNSKDHAASVGTALRSFLRIGTTRLLVLLLALFTLPAFAQYRASLQGTVVDAQGARVPGAHIVLTDKETNRTLEATSDETGIFTFNELAPSSYTFVATRDGFKKKALDNLKILAEQANALNVVLEVGSASETVTVNGSEQPTLDTETGAITGTIDQNDIAKMPSFGHDVFQLVQLAPGMFGDGARANGGNSASLPGSNSSGSGANSGIFQTENQPQASAAGGRTNSNGISLDGVQITSVTWGGAAVITPAEDSIKEMKVVANPYDAEYGRTSGAQIQMISQNGTNQYHGTGFFKLDRPGLNASPRWDPNGQGALKGDRNGQRFNQFGGTAGGPILRDKVFAFFSYESIRNHGTNPPNSGWYDTASFDSQSTSGTIASKFLTFKGVNATPSAILENPGDHNDCASIGLVEGVNCNWIQGKGLDLGKPLAIGVGKHDPSFSQSVKNADGSVTYTPGLGGDGTGSYANNMDGNADIFYIQTAQKVENINTQYNGRLDYQATPKDLVAYSIYYVPVDNTSSGDRPQDIFHHHQTNYSTGVIYDHTFSETLFNDARADMAGWRWNELKDNPQSPLGLPNAKISLAGGNAFSNMVPAQFGPNFGSIFNQWTLNFKDVATKVYKSHNLKFGGQYTRLAYEDAAPWAANATFDFNNYWDFLNDAPQSESVSGADPKTGVPTMSRKDDRQYIMSLFGQDDWKVKPNLTLNLGLRWEYFAGMTEKKGNNPVVELGKGSAMLTDLAVQLNRSQVDAPKYNFSPQFGFAWSPLRYNYKLVLRGGFGLAFNGLEEAITTNTRFNSPFFTNSANLTGSQIVYGTASDLHTPFALPANPALVSTFNSKNLPTSGTYSLTGIPTDLATSYVMHYSFEGQYDLGHQWVATLGYQGSAGRDLTIQTNLMNKLASKIIAGKINLNPALTGMDWYENTGRSNFNALLGEVRHQFAHTFEADVQYKWSHALDDGSQPYANSNYEWAPGYNYGSSDYDSRHMIKMFAVWTPTLFPHNAWAEKTIGGWTISPIFNYHSGFPWTPVYGGLGQDAVYQGSMNNGGAWDMRPVSYKGGASNSQSTDSFKTTGHFANGGPAYFTKPAVVTGSTGFDGTTAPTYQTLPEAPGVGRNSFIGPRYTDLDLAMTKAFGLPTLPILGENARMELRANAFNLYNKLNLASPVTDISNPKFGRAGSVLGGRTVEVEAHFRF